MIPGMRSKLFTKALLLLVGGGLFGLLIKADQDRWYRVGRDAFLAYQQKRFDLNVTHPGYTIIYIIGAGIFVLGLGALYEGVALAIDRMLGHRGHAANLP
jgi:hypothetical protein